MSNGFDFLLLSLIVKYLFMEESWEEAVKRILKIKELELKDVEKLAKETGIPPLLLPADIVSLESLRQEGYAIVQPNTKLTYYPFLLDLIIDVNSQRNHKGFDSIPIIDYTTYPVGCALNLTKAFLDFENTVHDSFKRALFFSSTPGDIIYYGYKVEEPSIICLEVPYIATLPFYLIDHITLKSVDKSISHQMMAEIVDVYEKFHSSK